VDRIDRQILALLQQDGRMTVTALAARVRLSVSPCHRRVRELERSGAIRGYRALIDPAAVGLTFEALVFVTMRQEDRDTLLGFEAALAEVPNVVHAQRLFGDPDYLLRVLLTAHLTFHPHLELRRRSGEPLAGRTPPPVARTDRSPTSSEMLDELARIFGMVGGDRYRHGGSSSRSGSAERRALSIPTVRDRVVQAAVKIVLEPIFEADFLPCSFGFRPKRSALDALQVLIDQSWRGQRWVVETDIANCFEAIPFDRLMQAVSERVCDSAVLRLVRVMLRAGSCRTAGYGDRRLALRRAGSLPRCWRTFTCTGSIGHGMNVGTVCWSDTPTTRLSCAIPGSRPRLRLRS